MRHRFTRSRAAVPSLRPLEALEVREVPAILIQLDYSRDTSGLFANNAEARATLEQVAAELGNSLTANLTAVTPGGNNTWTATFFDPATGETTSIPNLSIGANTIKVYVGARDLPGNTAAYGGYGGNSVSGAQSWLNTVQQRGHTGFATWGGSVTFDTAQNWHFGSTTVGLDANELDFYSVAVHELSHVLGFGTAPQWRNLVSGGVFNGAAATAVYGGPVPVTTDGGHWADGVTLNGQPVSLDPSLNPGRRVGLTALDAAALTDLGWNAAVAVSPPVAPAAPTPGPTFVPFAGTDGVVTEYAVYDGAVFATGRQFAPFPGYRGPLHQAHADFDADGVLDIAVATGTPGVGAMGVFSGRDGHLIGTPRLTYGTVAGLLAADVDADGAPDLVSGEGTPMGLYVFDVGDRLSLSAAYGTFGTIRADEPTALPPQAEPDSNAGPMKRK